MSESKSTKLRLVAILLNILILALCTASILSCFLPPLLEVKAKYVVKADDLHKMLKNEEELLNEINLEEIVGEGVTLKIAVAFSPMDSYRAVFTSNENKIIDRAIADNVNRLVDELTPTLNKIAERIVRHTVKTNVNDVIHEQVKNILSSEGKTDVEMQARVEEVLEKAQITDDYVTGKADEIIDEIYAENATVESVTNKIYDTVEEVFQKLESSGDPEFENVDLNLSEDDKASIKEEIEKVMQDLSLADEEGKLNTEDLAALIILNLMQKQQEETPSEDEEEGIEPSAYQFASDSLESGETSQEERNVREELKAEVRTYVSDAIPKSATKIIVLVLKIVGYVLLFTCLTWFYPALKIFCKIATRNPAIKFKLPILLGWIPALVFGIAPKIALSVLKNKTGKGFAEVNKVLSMLSLEINTATWMTFAAAMILIVLWFFYRPIRKKLKKMKDEE